MATKKINIGVVGSTGSVGKTSLKIFKKYKKQFNIELLVSLILNKKLQIK